MKFTVSVPFSVEVEYTVEGPNGLARDLRSLKVLLAAKDPYLDGDFTAVGLQVAEQFKSVLKRVSRRNLKVKPEK